MMRATMTTVSRSKATSSGSLLQRKYACGGKANCGCEECRKKREARLQRKQAGGHQPNSVSPIVHEVLNSPGQPLDAGTRAFMEPRFGHDFSQVRVHTDSQAAKSAEEMNALAYTVGRDIVFGTGRYAPQAETGRHLIAHELTHVLQQMNGGVSGDAESRARTSADQVLRGELINVGTAGGSPISLQKAGKDASTGAPASTSATSTKPVIDIDDFGFDKSDIPERHSAELKTLQLYLLSEPNATVVLTGHTDTVGKEKYNQGLGLRRAAAVRDFLTKQNGVNSSRIEIKSKGETEPAAGQPPAKLDPNKGEKDPRNRRVEILVTKPANGWTFSPADPQKKPIELNLHRENPANCPITPSNGGNPAPPQTGQKKEDEWKLGVGTTWSWQINPSPKSPAHSPTRTLQITFSSSSKETPLLSVFYQLTYNVDSQKFGAVTLMSGTRAATDITIIEGLLKAGIFVQALAGVVEAAGTAYGNVVIQASAGGQLTLKFGRVSFSLKADLAGQIPLGQNFQVGGTITISF